MEMYEFTESELMEHSGATAWNNGAPPLFASGTFENGEQYELVLDATGGCLMVDDAQLTAGGYRLHLPFPNQSAALVFAKGIGTPTHKLDFFLIGFAPA